MGQIGEALERRSRMRLLLLEDELAGVHPDDRTRLEDLRQQAQQQRRTVERHTEMNRRENSLL